MNIRQKVKLFVIALGAVAILRFAGPISRRIPLETKVVSRVPQDKTRNDTDNTTKQWSDTNVWNKSQKHECELVDPNLSSTPLPTTGLVSYPGSGNTWTRHLLQQVSGKPLSAS